MSGEGDDASEEIAPEFADGHIALLAVVPKLSEIEMRNLLKRLRDMGKTLLFDNQGDMKCRN
jgi:hypothetical protein